MSKITEDALLAGKISLRQPAKGFRTAIDAVFLAAAVPAEDGDMVLDAGTGVGSAALCLASRLPGVRVKGIEADGLMAELAVGNAHANGVAERVEFIHGDIMRVKGALTPGSFDHVMANPPFRKAGSGNAPPDPVKAAATIEGEATLADWIDFCVAMVRVEGSVTLIHHAGRTDEILSCMQGRLGDIVVFPLWPDDGGRPAKRVIIRGRKGMTAPTRTASGMALHDGDGAYTQEAQKILRDGTALAL
ncbi:MAG: hypothetical protein A3G18_06380 [Rhodospirillales bacterium RIFCSPLOWO2_12_FULL_58_28]|nr:MAG: hypothetical protein A3H92_03635 [Rhodospirillales bacterium RIFCSPLOWO2_02_FULL_58_16]OHC79544.1 MAG: hypothetical protein A3G18_06380 [Rhodospirillales bacterium RIFCSPLOWO2_12_FULL_58_28]